MRVLTNQSVGNVLSGVAKAASVVALCSIAAGCIPAARQLNQDGTGQPNYGAPGMAMLPKNEKNHQTQMVIPSDKRTSEAIDAALPNIKKMLAIHQCIKSGEALRQLNYLAIPGRDMAQPDNGWWDATSRFPNSSVMMKYHDRNKCLSVRALDQWTMPALNALQFRAVFFADDSGETVNFAYLFKKLDDGSWKLESLKWIAN